MYKDLSFIVKGIDVMESVVPTVLYSRDLLRIFKKVII
jgi:hypothetical protein